jgi:amphi-Trp domain-containing protein
MAKKATKSATKKSAKPDRDIEKDYTPKQFAAKLRRFADAVETGDAFSIQIAGERIRVPKGARFNIEHERDDAGEEIEFQIKWAAMPD